MLRFALSLAVVPLALTLFATEARAAGPDAADDDADDAPDRPAPPPPTWDSSKDRTSLGFAMGGMPGRTVGLAVGATSPRVAHWVRFDADAGVALFPHARPDDGKQVLDPYARGRLAIEIGPDFYGGFPIRPYAVLGPEIMLLPSALSSRRVAVGLAGALGVELAFPHTYGGSSATTLFAEGGGVISGASADSVPGDPTIENGVVFSAGVRAYL